MKEKKIDLPFFGSMSFLTGVM